MSYNSLSEEGYEDPDSGQWVSLKEEKKNIAMTNYGDYRMWYDPITTNKLEEDKEK